MQNLRLGGGFGPWAFTGFVGLASVVQIGCGSSLPVRSLRAARYYAEGTRALDASDPPRAIAELERAAALMPEASEIQNHLGLAYWSAQREADALRSLERAVELDCSNEAARTNLERLREVRAEREESMEASESMESMETGSRSHGG